MCRISLLLHISVIYRCPFFLYLCAALWALLSSLFVHSVGVRYSQNATTRTTWTPNIQHPIREFVSFSPAKDFNVSALYFVMLWELNWTYIKPFGFVWRLRGSLLRREEDDVRVRANTTGENSGWMCFKCSNRHCYYLLFERNALHYNVPLLLAAHTGIKCTTYRNTYAYRNGKTWNDMEQRNYIISSMQNVL